VITALVGVIVVAFAFEAVLSRPSLSGVAGGLLVPRFDGTESILLGAGILGATVMPHVVYLHSALTQRRVIGRNDDERRRILRFEKVDVVIAMTLAGLVNISMMLMAGALFHDSPLANVDSVESAYGGLRQLISQNAATIFGVALLTSGLASSSVGTMSGQIVMQGFIQRRIPIFVRRAVTLLPALVVVAIGVDPSGALVFSQVVLSFGIPFALVPLLLVGRRRDLMGALANPGWLTAIASVLAALIIALNLFLLQQAFFG
jgi:manganese transport protein